MKIVIDIPDYDLKQIKKYYEESEILECVYSYIYHGQPLSEIIDKISAEIQEKVKSVEGGNAYHVANGLNMALSIIEKYKGDSE